MESTTKVNPAQLTRYMIIKPPVPPLARTRPEVLEKRCQHGTSRLSRMEDDRPRDIAPSSNSDNGEGGDGEKLEVPLVSVSVCVIEHLANVFPTSYLKRLMLAHAAHVRFIIKAVFTRPSIESVQLDFCPFLVAQHGCYDTQMRRRGLERTVEKDAR